MRIILRFGDAAGVFKGLELSGIEPQLINLKEGCTFHLRGASP